jgi:hypothetical protein
MWKDFALCGASSAFTYFRTKEVCGEIMTMTVINFIVNLITLTLVLLKQPVNVVDTRNPSDLR